MSASYYKDKPENIKVSLIIRQLVSSLLLSPTHYWDGPNFCKLCHNRKIEPCNAWRGKILKFTRFLCKILIRDWLTRVVFPMQILLKVRLSVALKEEAKWQVFVRDCEHWILLLYRILILYCVLFVIMSINIEKNSAVSEEGHVLTAYGFFLVVSLASMQIKSFWNPFSKIKLRT